MKFQQIISLLILNVFLLQCSSTGRYKKIASYEGNEDIFSEVGDEIRNELKETYLENFIYLKNFKKLKKAVENSKTRKYLDPNKILKKYKEETITNLKFRLLVLEKLYDYLQNINYQKDNSEIISHFFDLLDEKRISINQTIKVIKKTKKLSDLYSALQDFVNDNTESDIELKEQFTNKVWNVSYKSKILASKITLPIVGIIIIAFSYMMYNKDSILPPPGFTDPTTDTRSDDDDEPLIKFIEEEPSDKAEKRDKKDLAQKETAKTSQGKIKKKESKKTKVKIQGKTVVVKKRETKKIESTNKKKTKIKKVKKAPPKKVHPVGYIGWSLTFDQQKDLLQRWSKEYFIPYFDKNNVNQCEIKYSYIDGYYIAKVNRHQRLYTDKWGYLPQIAMFFVSSELQKKLGWWKYRALKYKTGLKKVGIFDAVAFFVEKIEKKHQDKYAKKLFMLFIEMAKEWARADETVRYFNNNDLTAALKSLKEVVDGDSVDLKKLDNVIKKLNKKVKKAQQKYLKRSDKNYNYKEKQLFDQSQFK